VGVLVPQHHPGRRAADGRVKAPTPRMWRGSCHFGRRRRPRRGRGG
jgi:hypothetical protein